jgi:thymidylate synthase ThyX
MITVTGKNGIKATVLAYSISQAGKKFITWEIEYPRLVLAELNTHRQLSRNSFSSRAVPFLKMIEQLDGEPVRFGANQAGMQDKGEDYNEPVAWFGNDDAGNVVEAKFGPRSMWKVAKKIAVALAKAFYEAGYHKQVYNRLLEPFQMMKTVLSATEIDNFFWLRDDDAADPTLRELARVMREAMEASTPRGLQAGEWHLPYIVCVRDFERARVKDRPKLMGTFYSGVMEYWMDDTFTQKLTLEEAIKVSCARCAAVSYRNEGYGLEKSLEIYENLVGGDKKHASAFEHCATPMASPVVGDKTRPLVPVLNVPQFPDTWEPGVTHLDRNRRLWSGNLQGWVQYRKLIPGECYKAGE